MVFMPHWPKIIGKSPINLGLDRVEQVLQRLGNPQDKLPPVIHVAGTNGKGSTIAFLRSILQKAGYKVHCYTSPHLINFNERITISNNEISDMYLKQVMETCRLAADEIPVTFFEGTTIGAFYAFSQVNADVVLLETGLGGRLDATNVVKKPAATIITTISLDHTEYLGPTIELIAGEKAGIIKKDTPCIISLQTESVFNVLENYCHKKNAPMCAFEYDWIVEKEPNNIIFKSPEYEVSFPYPNLVGEHQIINCANAIATIKQIPEFDITDKNIADGITNAKWAARLQKIEESNDEKLSNKGYEIWLDGAHNDAAAFALANYAKQWTKKPLYLIVGMTKGRDVTSFLKYFEEIADFVCAVNIKTEPSAYNSEYIYDKAKEIGFYSQAFNSVNEALQFIKKDTKSQYGIILCCGSLYLASDIMALK